MKWHSNLNRVMESGNHYKNGTSPKILMIWSIFILFFITVTGCDMLEDDYLLEFDSQQTIMHETIWNGWRINVVSRYVVWYRFESKHYSGDMTFFFTYGKGNRTDSTTVRDIRPGKKFYIGAELEAHGGNYVVNQTSVSGSTMQYWIKYNDYSETTKLWTDDMVVSTTLKLKRQFTAFDSFMITENWEDQFK